MISSLTPIQSISRETLDRLVSNRTPESKEIEYKSTVYSLNYEGNKEFLKDISAFSNTSGGILFIGITEEDGVASGISPISEIDQDKLKQRLENLLQDGLEPRVFGIQIVAIDYGCGYVLVVRVPASANGPHRIKINRSNRFFLRSSAGAYEPSMDELRTLFGRESQRHRDIGEFIRKRRDLIKSNSVQVRLAEPGGKLVIHIVPVHSLEYADIIDMSDLKNVNSALKPPTAESYSYKFNVDGYILFRSGDPTSGYTQLFRDGKIEAVKCNIVGSEKNISADRLKMILYEFVVRALEYCHSVNVNPPFYVTASLQGVGGSTIYQSIQSDEYERPLPIYYDDFDLPGVLFHELFNQEYYQVRLNGLSVPIWNAAGSHGRF
jgi:hypothetical protein